MRSWGAAALLVLAAHAAASLDAALAFGRERQSALTDPLTALLNRRGLELRLDDALGAAQREREPVSLLVLDCDDFKVVNDRAGHEFGDALLRETARALSSLLPAGASGARVGGDEFVVLLPRTGAEAAEAVGNELRLGLGHPRPPDRADRGPLRALPGGHLRRRGHRRHPHQRRLRLHLPRGLHRESRHGDHDRLHGGCHDRTGTDHRHARGRGCNLGGDS